MAWIINTYSTKLRNSILLLSRVTELIVEGNRNSFAKVRIGVLRKNTDSIFQWRNSFIKSLAARNIKVLVEICFIYKCDGRFACLGQKKETKTDLILSIAQLKFKHFYQHFCKREWKVKNFNFQITMNDPFISGFNITL